jgi:hypothetical protein
MYADGGFIQSTVTNTVTVRNVEGAGFPEYWDEWLSRWVPILTLAKAKEIGWLQS